MRARIQRVIFLIQLVVIFSANAALVGAPAQGSARAEGFVDGRLDRERDGTNDGCDAKVSVLLRRQQWLRT